MPNNKIALFCHNLEINGANVFVLTLARTFLDDNVMTVYAPREGRMRARFEAAGVAVNVLDGDFSFDELKGFSVVIINTLMMSRLVVECARRKVPHILVVHETWRPDRLDYYLKTLWRIDDVPPGDIIAALSTSRRVVFPSKHLRDVYKSLVDEKRMSTIYCSIEMEQIDEYRARHRRDDVRAALGIDEETVLFIHVGTVTLRKAQMSTLRAFHAMRRQLGGTPNVELMFIGARRFRPGEREYVQEISHEIDRLGLAGCVRIYDVQDDPYKFYLAADVLAHPAINEVLPLAIVEACYCEVPVIVSQLDGMPEIVRNGREGLWVNPYDLSSLTEAMLRLARSPELRRTLGANARVAVAHQHSLERFRDNYRQLIEDVTSDARRVPPAGEAKSHGRKEGA